MKDADVSAGGLVRLRTFALVAGPLVIPILFTIFYVPQRHEASLHDVNERKAEVLATIFSANSAAKVDFDDKDGLRQLLESATQDPDLIYAVVYGTESPEALASVGNLSRVTIERRGLKESRTWAGDGLIHSVHPVRAGPNKAPVGFLQLGL